MGGCVDYVWHLTWDTELTGLCNLHFSPKLPFDRKFCSPFHVIQVAKCNWQNLKHEQNGDLTQFNRDRRKREGRKAGVESIFFIVRGKTASFFQRVAVARLNLVCHTHELLQGPHMRC
jgi:hypothetical protein